MNLNNVKISWKGYEIGEMINISTDVSFLEGKFIPNLSSHSIEFQEFTSNLDFKTVYEDPTKGTRILFGNNFESCALVLTLCGDGVLLLQQVSKEESKEWLLKNVV